MQRKDRKSNEKLQAKRTKLIELSITAKKLRAQFINSAKTPAEVELWSTRTINYILLRYVYNNGAELRYETFKEWKAQGATIKKGAKATVIWGQPRKGAIMPDNENIPANVDASNDSEDMQEYEFFPLCFLFSENDVFFPQAGDEITKPESEPEIHTHTSVDCDLLNEL